jgi:hypothetical protein
VKLQWRRIKPDDQRVLNFENSEEKIISPLLKVVPNGMDKVKQVPELKEGVDSSKFETDFPDDLEAICNVVSILPLDFSVPVEEVEEQEFFDEDEGLIIIHYSIPFDTKNVVVFPMPTEGMK